MRLVGALGVALVAAACSGGGTSAPAAPVDATTPDAATADEACAPGSARLGSSAACVRGPWAECGADHDPAPSGWGCRDRTPREPCNGATREAVGSAACVPVGDCDAPFPPPGAIIVDGASAVVDATHKRTIGAAIAVAAPGTVVAVEAGSYAENLSLDRDVTIVGRCPAKVSLQGTGLAAQGIRVLSGRAVVRGITVRNQPTVGVSVAPFAAVELEDVVLEDNGMAGVSLSDGDATAKIARSVIRGTRQSSVSGEGGWGANAQAGSTLTITDVAFSGNQSSGVRLSTQSKGTLDGVVIRGTRRNRVYDFGRGLSVIRGAQAKMTRSALLDNAEVSIVVGDESARLDMSDVVIRDTVPSEGGGLFGRALNLHGGARVEGTRVWIHDNRDAAVMVAEVGSHLTLRSSVVSGTALDRDGHVGRGVTVQEGASADLFDVAIAGSHEVGLAVFAKGTRVRAERTAIVHTKPNLGPAFGNGVLVTDDGLVELVDVEVASNYGIGVAIGPAAAILSLARVRSNTVGLYVQDGTTLREVGSADGMTPAAREVIVTTDSPLAGNGTRFTAGVVPLPAPIVAK